MDLTPNRVVEGRGDQSWLGSAYGTDACQSVTLKFAAFTAASGGAATYYPNGYLASGTPLGKYTSGGNTGKYGPYTVGATDGTQNLAGFLFTSIAVPRDGVSDIQGALLDHGRVIVAKLPVATVDGTAQATNPRFIFV